MSPYALYQPEWAWNGRTENRRPPDLHLDIRDYPLPEVVPRIFTFLWKVPHPLVLKCFVITKPKDRPDEALRDLRGKLPIPGRDGNNVLPVGLHDKVCVDQEFETHLADGQKREHPLVLQDGYRVRRQGKG